MRLLHIFIFGLLVSFAATLRARPFAWEGTTLAAHVQTGGVALRARNMWKPEGAADTLLKIVHERAGEKGLSILALVLFGAAVLMTLDAAAQLAGFGAACLLAVPFLPLALGNSAPDPWLFSAFFTMLMLNTMARVRRQSWPSYMVVVLPAVAAVWPLFHSAGVLLAPLLSLLMVADGVMAWWADENAPQGGIFTAPPDPLLFQAEELDMQVFFRVLSWETKMNQFLHQRLGLTPAQLPSLTAGRAAEVLNSLLDIADLPDEVGVPDPGLNGGDVRARNRKMLDVQYRDALRPIPAKKEPLGAAVTLRPLPLWVPITAAAVSFAAVAVPPAGPQALGQLFSAISDAGSLLSVPSGWWVSSSHNPHPAANYFWTSLALFLAVGLVGLMKNRHRFSAPFFAGGLLLFAVVLPVPDATPLVALTSILFSAAALRGLQREETLLRTMGVTAGVIASLVAMHLIDWDNLPLGMTPRLGAVPPVSTAVR